MGGLSDGKIMRLFPRYDEDHHIHNGQNWSSGPTREASLSLALKRQALKACAVKSLSPETLQLPFAMSEHRLTTIFVPVQSLFLNKGSDNDARI